MLVATKLTTVMYDPERFAHAVGHPNCDGAIFLTRDAVRGSGRYVAMGDDSWVYKVTDEPISEWQTCGLYWWRKREDFALFGVDYMRAIEDGWNIRGFVIA